MTLNKPRKIFLQPYNYHLMKDPHQSQLSLTQVRRILKVVSTTRLPSSCTLPFNFFRSWLFNTAKRSTQLSRFKSIKIISLALKTTQLLLPQNYALSHYPRGAQSIQKSNGHLNILSATWMTWSKFHTHDTQKVGATSQIWYPRQPGARDLCNPALFSKLKLGRPYFKPRNFTILESPFSCYSSCKKVDW